MGFGRIRVDGELLRAALHLPTTTKVIGSEHSGVDVVVIVEDAAIVPPATVAPWGICDVMPVFTKEGDAVPVLTDWRVR